jgi:hypothetical protein
MKKIWILMLGLASISLVPQARAQDPENIADVRCVLVGFRLQQAGSSVQKSSGVMLALYYLGRLDGRSPGLNLEQLAAEQARRMSDPDYASEAKRCGKDLGKKGQQIARLGKDFADGQQNAPREKQ